MDCDGSIVCDEKVVKKMKLSKDEIQINSEVLSKLPNDIIGIIISYCVGCDVGFLREMFKFMYKENLTKILSKIPFNCEINEENLYCKELHNVMFSEGVKCLTLCNLMDKDIKYLIDNVEWKYINRIHLFFIKNKHIYKLFKTRVRNIVELCVNDLINFNEFNKIQEVITNKTITLKSGKTKYPESLKGSKPCTLMIKEFPFGILLDFSKINFKKFECIVMDSVRIDRYLCELLFKEPNISEHVLSSCKFINENSPNNYLDFKIKSSNSLTIKKYIECGTITLVKVNTINFIDVDMNEIIKFKHLNFKSKKKIIVNIVTRCLNKNEIKKECFKIEKMLIKYFLINKNDKLELGRNLNIKELNIAFKINKHGLNDFELKQLRNEITYCENWLHSVLYYALKCLNFNRSFKEIC